MSLMNNMFRLTGRMGGPMEKSFNPNNGNPIGRVSIADNAYYNDPNRPMASGDVASPSSYRPDQTDQSDRPLDKSA